MMWVRIKALSGWIALVCIAGQAAVAGVSWYLWYMLAVSFMIMEVSPMNTVQSAMDRMLSARAKFAIVTCLTLSRFFAGAYLFWFGLSYKLFAFGLLTDFCDGLLARRWNVVSNTGATLDQLADKFLCFCTLRAMVHLPKFHWVYPWFIMILARDILVSVARVKAKLPTSMLAKYKTAAIACGICLLLLQVDFAVTPMLFTVTGCAALCIGTILSWVDCVLKLRSAYRRING